MGYDTPHINNMLKELYDDINFHYSIIGKQMSKFWGNWFNILSLFFKPMLQQLIEYDFDWQDIANALHRHLSYQKKTEL